MKNQNNFNLAICFLILLVIACACPKKQGQDYRATGLSVSPELAKKSPVPAPLVDVPKLINQSPQNFDATYGKPVKVTPITGNRKDAPGEFRDYRISGVTNPQSTDAGLTVVFHQNKVIGFLLDLPKAVSVETALAQIGIDVHGAPPTTKTAGGQFWQNITLNGIRYDFIKVLKVGDNLSADEYDVAQVEIRSTR